MNDSLQQQCSISDSLLEQQNQNSSIQSVSYYNSMLKKLRYQISLKDHAIQTASYLINQLRHQNIKLIEQHQKQLQTRDRTIEQLTNKIVQMEQSYKKLTEYNKQTSQSKSKTSNTKLLKQILHNKQISEFDIMEKKQHEKQKLKSRFKNYLNLSNYDSKNNSVTAFDSQTEDGRNLTCIPDKSNKNYYTNINQNSVSNRINSQKNIQTTKKNGSTKKVYQVQTKINHNNNVNQQMVDKQFLLMMQQIQLLKDRVDQKDDQILMMMKRNKQVQEKYTEMVERVNYNKGTRGLPAPGIPNRRLY